RRAAAERWWRHETGQSIEVREGVAWLLRYESEEDASAHAAELAVLDGRRRGLLCNPHAQDHALAAGDEIPLPWIGAAAMAGGKGATRGASSSGGDGGEEGGGVRRAGGGPAPP